MEHDDPGGIAVLLDHPDRDVFSLGTLPPIGQQFETLGRPP